MARIYNVTSCTSAKDALLVVSLQTLMQVFGLVIVSSMDALRIGRRTKAILYGIAALDYIRSSIITRISTTGWNDEALVEMDFYGTTPRMQNASGCATLALLLLKHLWTSVRPEGTPFAVMRAEYDLVWVNEATGDVMRDLDVTHTKRKVLSRADSMDS